MIKKNQSVCIVAALLLAGCVTSTTTGPKRSEPNDREAAEQYYQLGARYYRNGNYELARERLERSLEYDPRLAIAHSTLALAYEGLHNTRKASGHYKLALRYAPKDVDVRNNYAVFLCRQQDFDAAREQFDVAVDLVGNDNPAVSLTNAGVCMAQKPDYAAAEAYLREALKRRPKHAEALFQMSALKFRTEEYSQARAYTRRYLSTHKPNA
ncbi:MAG: type IV pilus biogenesis/stability protein PilW, partial [Woeseiaceae bacterium]